MTLMEAFFGKSMEAFHETDGVADLVVQFRVSAKPDASGGDGTNEGTFLALKLTLPQCDRL